MIRKLTFNSESSAALVKTGAATKKVVAKYLSHLTTKLQNSENLNNDDIVFIVSEGLGQIGPEAKSAISLLLQVIERCPLRDVSEIPMIKKAIEALGKIGCECPDCCPNSYCM